VKNPENDPVGVDLEESTYFKFGINNLEYSFLLSVQRLVRFATIVCLTLKGLKTCGDAAGTGTGCSYYA
jgi:hypothetical protein